MKVDYDIKSELTLQGSFCAIASCPIHSSLEPFARLIGEWEGQGYMYLYTRTAYPCTENISIGHIGQPSFWYRWVDSSARLCRLVTIIENSVKE